MNLRLRFPVCTFCYRFLSIGDWGDTEAKFVSGVMGDYSPEFILALGDNFYDE